MKSRKVITYKGVNLSGSDLSCADGELYESINIIPSATGELTAMIPPKPIGSVDGALLAVHHTSTGTHYICKSASAIIFYLSTTGEDNEPPVLSKFTIPLTPLLGNCIGIEILGNTVIFSFSVVGLYYALFKDGDYLLLGDRLPELNISFGLRSKYIKSDEHSVSIESLSLTSQMGHITLSEENASAITDAVMAKYNKYLQEEVRDKDLFAFPFFVRYAYRLYDGSTYMPSAPILLTPSNLLPPLVIITNTNATEGGTIKDNLKYRIEAFLCEVDYSMGDGWRKVEQWSDIIESVDIFISDPIYNYDQNGTIKSLHIAEGLVSGNMKIKYTTLSNFNGEAHGEAPLYRKKLSVSQIPNARQVFAIQMPAKETKAFTSDLVSKSLFYKVASVDIQNIKDERSLLIMTPGVLNSLQVQESLIDDYNTHCRIIPQRMYSYNQRLNIANFQMKLFYGFSAWGQSIYNNSHWQAAQESLYTYTIYTFIDEGGKKHIVKQTSAETMFDIGDYVFYPSPGAYKMLVVRHNPPPSTLCLMSTPAKAAEADPPEGGSGDNDSAYIDPDNPGSGGGGSTGSGGGSTGGSGGVYDPNNSYLELTLEKHKLLNGAYWFSGFEEQQWSDRSETVTVSKDTLISYPQKLALSQVNNPFYFPLENINTISNGEILSMVSTTKALSQGQFGQFPLYIFTTAGIWAMNISDTGTYSFKQVVTRDVALSSSSITQTDIGVVFTSLSGLHLLLGSETVNLSAALNGKPFNSASLPLFDAQSFESMIDGESFMQYIRNCSIGYDYALNRLIIINPTKPYHYIYDIARTTFAKASGGLTRAVNAYPDTIVQDSANRIYSVTSRDLPHTYPKPIEGIVITRPIKFDNPTALKTIERLRNKAALAHGSSIRIALYASRDAHNYFHLHSLRGNPFAYYIFVFYLNILATESLCFTVCDIDTRFGNKAR